MWVINSTINSQVRSNKKSFENKVKLLKLPEKKKLQTNPCTYPYLLSCCSGNFLNCNVYIQVRTINKILIQNKFIFFLNLTFLHALCTILNNTCLVRMDWNKFINSINQIWNILRQVLRSCMKAINNRF